MLHWVPEAEDLNDSRPAATPCKVSTLATVWVEVAGKVKVEVAEALLVKLKNVLEPEIVWSVPSNVTVPEEPENVPPVLARLPEIVIVPAGLTVPPLIVRLPLISVVPEPPVNVPDETVSPP